jgi:putative GTP pyrophosphokinase
VYEKDYITNKKESGYRSYHLIVEYPVQTSLGMKPVLAEIQIRTLAMNFWATIEHSLNYKYKESVLPEEVRKRLSKAAEAAYKLDKEMSSIREEIVEAQRMFEDNSNLVSHVLSHIQQLYFYHRIREAAQFQLRFNEIWEKEELFLLPELSHEIELAIAKAKRGDQG